MGLRFDGAIATAVALHAGLVCVGVWLGQHPRPVTGRALAWETIEFDLLHLEDEVPRPPTSESLAFNQQDVERQPRVATTHVPSKLDDPARTPLEPASRASAAPNEGRLSSGHAADSAAAERRAPAIDLGIDGLTQVWLAPRSPTASPPARRQAPAIDGWSEAALRSVAEARAPLEGSALLTVEWDASGRLQRLHTSAHSTDAADWHRLVAELRSQLARRPHAAEQRRGLRLTYLIRSEVVYPGRHSKIPESRHASGQQLLMDTLPPGNALMLGVKADASPGGQRVISLTLSSSQAF